MLVLEEAARAKQTDIPSEQLTFIASNSTGSGENFGDGQSRNTGHGGRSNYSSGVNGKSGGRSNIGQRSHGNHQSRQQFSTSAGSGFFTFMGHQNWLYTTAYPQTWAL